MNQTYWIYNTYLLYLECIITVYTSHKTIDNYILKRPATDHSRVPAVEANFVNEIDGKNIIYVRT